MELFILSLRLVIALIVVLSLMALLYKASDNKIREFNNSKYIKVLERTQISKDSALLLVKIGEEGFIMASSPNKTEIIKSLNAKEIENYEANKPEINYENILKNYFNKKQKGEKNE